ncbi:glycogen synthase GlgA [Rhizomicrobium electricum]|uniref:Glycogen synthase n=1 Tax=Rhizomicrobium electricum TaxID=480070 RepID=A0ABN1EQ24_9PROT|nr:glycogen synthase GlgA [Rhizomicrobium electricum]NIJ48878.1 starch synthase [Rhizomicrobium electricum]
MRLLFVTSEAYPLAKTGGLADVSRSLPAALKRQGADITVLMPAYPRAVVQLRDAKVVTRLGPAFGITDGLLIAGTFPDCDLPVLLVSSATLFGRDGGLYQDNEGADWGDNALRFAYFSKAAADLALGRTDIGWLPDLVHANDWHTGLLPYFLAHHEGARPRTVFTTHNMAFQGNFGHGDVPDLGHGDFEFYGKVSYLKAGLRYADRVTTVSPTYAREILTPEYGFGLDGVLAARGSDFCGILNGIDETIWNPATDRFLPANYRPRETAGKRVCKRELQRELGLPPAPDVPVIGFVSRLTHQKMADALIEALPWIAERGAQLAVVGEGDRAIEATLAHAAEQHPTVIAATVGYDETLAHKLQAGSDILLAPARFEPCGLTQLYALKYGTLPVVRRTGGLADTVVDTNNLSICDRTASGFVFDDPTTDGMISALSRALALYRDQLHWRLVQLQAMTRTFGWDRSAGAYMDLYRGVTGIAPKWREEETGDDEDMRRAAG